ncbi:hypothetical protein [Spiroplasma ixodetis]|uniref:hypothetical protein n=1 Tax=Spiroplasma ixodetis TaxID=2141 RepID=UPI002578C714|nr:hypothetical protein [Spiroplasma ixodetis]WJG69559.1 hypothetical protein SIXOD_v1c04460 [Spiroplasma ixodetis Y32]
MIKLKLNSFEEWIETNTKLYFDKKEETFKNNDNKNQKKIINVVMVKFMPINVITYVSKNKIKELEKKG